MLSGSENRFQTSARPKHRSGRFSRGPSALGTDVIPDERIGVDAEELLAVADAVAIGIRVEGIGAVEVGFVTIRDPIAIRVRVGGIQTKARLQLVGRVVRILIGRAGDRRVGRLRCAFPPQVLAAGAGGTSLVTGAGSAPGSTTVTPRPGRRSVQTIIWSPAGPEAVQVPSVPLASS